ncbi:MAG: DEAD/DEAH box helicase [Promethearchaeota archaeon]
MLLKEGMKVIAKNDPGLGIGEIILVQEEQGGSYKVLFPDVPVKTLFPHEIRRILIDKHTLVNTKYGRGWIVDSIKKSGNDYYKYDVFFGVEGGTRKITENVIVDILPGLKENELFNNLEFADAKSVGIFLASYYFKYCLPRDPKYQVICHGRIEVFPYQIGVINRVLNTYPARFLLCDEVGLGKTIEALAILKEMILQGIIHRVIIIVPANLVPQWQFELESKFNLSFMVYDGKKIKSLKQNFPGINPWKIHRYIITSLHFAKRDENKTHIEAVPFDMAIFDEAHHLRRYHSNTGHYYKTKNYELGEVICRNSNFVLFLTATPMQLSPFELYSLVYLLDPTLFPKYSNFLEFNDKISHFNLVLRNLDKFNSLNVFEKKYMIQAVMSLLNDEWKNDEDSVRRLLVEKAPVLKNKIIKKIRENHLLSRVLIRNKKKHVFIGKLPKRIIKIILIEPTEAELNIYNAIRLYITEVYQRSLEEHNNATGFVMVVFQKMLVSSHQALRSTIHKRILKLREYQLKLMKNKVRLENNALNIDQEERERKIAFIDDKVESIDDDIKILSGYNEKLRSLKHDSKAIALVNIIVDLIGKEKNTKIIIFTQFIKSLNYIKKLL